MEEKILNELKNINLQIQEFDSKIDEKLKAQREEICSEIDAKIDAKLKAQKEEICSELRQEYEEKLDSKLENLKEFIMSDVKKAFREHMDVIYDRKNKEHHEIVEELREHKVRTLKGVRAFERSLTV